MTTKDGIRTSSYVHKVGDGWAWTISRETRRGPLIVDAGFEKTRTAAFEKCGEATDKYRSALERKATS